MDFVTGLPKSHVYDLIYVVVDMLTKMTHLFPVHKDDKAKDIAHIFIKEFFFIMDYQEGLFQTETPRLHQIFGEQSLKPTKPSCPLAQLIILRRTDKRRE